MEVFISWSGEYSHKLAITLKDWLSNVIQTIDPWVSSEDIEKGDRWFTDITQKLDICNIGIICLTKDNYQAPWINFEAGSLSKKLGEGKVCTLLLDLKPTDIKGPLTQFQATIATDKDDMRKLIKNINDNLLDKKIKNDIVSQAFEKWWENYFEVVNTIISINPSQVKSKKIRSNEDILEEILVFIRDFSKDKRSGREFAKMLSDEESKKVIMQEQIRELIQKNAILISQNESMQNEILILQKKLNDYENRLILEKQNK